MPPEFPPDQVFHGEKIRQEEFARPLFLIMLYAARKNAGPSGPA
jgi:hypothetical protein